MYNTHLDKIQTALANYNLAKAIHAEGNGNFDRASHDLSGCPHYVKESQRKLLKALDDHLAAALEAERKLIEGVNVIVNNMNDWDGYGHMTDIYWQSRIEQVQRDYLIATGYLKEGE